MRSMSLFAGLLTAVVASAGSAQADSWKDEYWDGNCKVERKWKDNGEYKEKRKCKGPARQVYIEPAPVYAVPRGVYMGAMPMAVGPAPGLPGIACNRDVIGGVLGGAAGGLIGNQFGKGDGRTAATIGGVVVGALLGGSVGRSMDEVDQACIGQALEYGRSNQPVAWRNPHGNYYEVTPVRSYDRHGSHCREYVTSATIDGRHRRVTGTACREPDGMWRLMN